MNAARALAATGLLETPVAVVEVDLLERNLERMAGIAAAAGVRLRPHAKTHKSAWVARRQLAHGAIGVTVATLVEAEAFAAAGVEDILLAHPPASEPKLLRLGELAGRVRRLAVSLDDTDLARRLPDQVEVLWEVDTGYHRIGSPPGPATVAAVAGLIAAIGQRRFRGLITHGGHSYLVHDGEGRRRVAAEEGGGLIETAGMLRAEGVEVRELSVGSTPTAEFAGEQEGITEMRPGTYVYGDARQVALGSHRLEDLAFGVVATVVSAPAPERAVVDAGSKALSADARLEGSAYGMVLDHPYLRLDRLSEEHGMITADGATGLAVGDRVVISPSHVCTAVNNHPAVLMIEADGATRWEPIAAHGWR